MSCVREASPPLPDDQLRHDIKKRRFLQPWRGLRRIFRRKGRPVCSTASDEAVDTAVGAHSRRQYDICDQSADSSNLEPAKSHSTSQLTDDQIENSQRRSLKTTLSVSHDSVFTSEQRSPDSGSETSLGPIPRLPFPHSNVRDELVKVIQKRRGQDKNTSDDEDLGLPRSPASNSPTAADDMFPKENMVTKSSQSTCSDKSLLSMESSEMDEESYCQSSRNSSKHSLYEKRTPTSSDSHHNDRSSNSVNSADASSLSHSAAKHKMAVKPKRNHGAPHKKRQVKTSNTLPTTPEVNEDGGSRTVPPSAATSTATKEKPVADSRHSDEHHLPSKTARSTEHHLHPHTSVTQITGSPSPSQSKRCNLPRKISLSPVLSFKSTKSKSPAASVVSMSSSAIYDDVADDERDAAGKREDGGGSFFSRLLLRRSSKKKKNATDESVGQPEYEVADLGAAVTIVEEQPESQPQKVPRYHQSQAFINGSLTAAALRNSTMFRQRIEPLNLPAAEPQLSRTRISVNMNSDGSNVSPVSNVHGGSALTIAHGSSTSASPSYSVTNASLAPTSTSSYASSTTSAREATSCSVTTVVDVKERASVQKSHSFRSSACAATKLPYSCFEDPSPSLPPNVGLVGAEVHEYDDVAEEAAATGFKDEKRSSDEEAGAYEAVNLQVETKNEVEVPAYSNVSVLNTLNINVNERTEGRRSSIADEVGDVAAKTVQIPEIKAPVPAPRTSLLNKTPSLNRSDEKHKFQLSSPAQPQPHLADDCINVTVTEIDDGQKSIISISGRPSVSSELEAEVVASSGCEADIDDDDEDEEDGKPAVAVADDFDDVFEPVTESTRIEDLPSPAAPAPPTPTTPLSISINSPAGMSPHELSQASAPTTPESASQPAEYPTSAPADSKPPIVAAKPGEKTRLRSIGNRMDVNSAPPAPPSKPTIVCDPTSGTMKVNDTVVVMRRKPVSNAKDEEPELMKVFARRSLKLKESDDSGALSGEECSSPLHKSRDSDKENEDANSPTDERRRKDSAPDSMAARPFVKFQRSISHDMVPITSCASDKRQRCKSTPEEVDKHERQAKYEQPAPPKNERPPPPSTPAPELTSPSDSSGSDTAPEERVTATTPFKRIQQRREEWEKRAQQAMKIHGVK